MGSFRSDRAEEDVRRELTDILRVLKDPRITGLISIVRVELARDLSYCTVYVSSIDGKEAAQNAVVGLKSAAGFVRRELNLRLKLRRSPQLRFIADDSIEYSADMANIFKGLNNGK